MAESLTAAPSKKEQASIIEANSTIKVSLLNSETLASNADGYLSKLNSFVHEYWLSWGLSHQQDVTFVYLSGENVFPALAAGDIDVVGLTTITGDDPDNLYSIPYASFKQKIFKHLQGNNQKLSKNTQP